MKRVFLLLLIIALGVVTTEESKAEVCIDEVTVVEQWTTQIDGCQSRNPDAWCHSYKILNIVGAIIEQGTACTGDSHYNVNTSFCQII